MRIRKDKFLQRIRKLADAVMEITFENKILKLTVVYINVYGQLTIR